MQWKELTKFIEQFNNHVNMNNLEEDIAFLETWELDMAKALLKDDPETSVKIAKIILASKGISDINIKIE